MEKPASLLDVQGLQDSRGVDLQQVGVSHVAMPVSILEKSGKSQTVSATARLSVGLGAAHKGTHMSRFILQLTEWSQNKLFSLNFKEFLEETQARLSAPSAQLDLKFRYFIEKQAPVSQMSAPMGYDCQFVATLSPQNTYQLALGLTVPIATLCPCSKAISEYGAHNQRAEIRVQVLLDTDVEQRVVWIEDLVNLLDNCSSCPVYPLVKREDEKFMTEWAYDHPKFVEDVIREAILALRSYPGITGFNIEIEALESIHGHNAWATHQENFQLL